MAGEKISKVVRRRYLVSLVGIKVKSYIKFFAVPKGEDDIRMVYDANANHLNDCACFLAAHCRLLGEGIGQELLDDQPRRAEHVPKLSST
jgi:hypothetical protein